MEHKIKVKQVFWFFAVLMIIIWPLGKAAVGFTPFAEANGNVDAANSASTNISADKPSETLPPASVWIPTNWQAGNSFFHLFSSKNKVFARTWDSFNGGRMFLAANDGTNWTQIASADSSIDILSIVMLDAGILAGTWNGFFQSTDNGTTWNTFTPTGIPADAIIWSVVMMNNTLFAGTTGKIYKSADNGFTWAEISSGIPVDARITSIVASGDNLFAGSADNGVFKSTNNGTSWTANNSNLTDTHISQLVVLDTKLFAVTLTGVFVSDNGGTNWAADSSGLGRVNCLVAINDQLMAGTEKNGAYLSVDKGVTWTSFNTGMPANTRIWSLAVSSEGIFAGTSSGIWVTDSPTAVEGEIPVPKTFVLKQNYPNPFHSSTNISFSIPSKSFVSLKIYDRLGREVATIISEEIPAGQYTRKWNADHTLGGIYFYRLQAGSYTETKKLILLP